MSKPRRAESDVAVEAAAELRTMLGLEPAGDDLIVDPALRSGIGRIELLDTPGRWGKRDAFGRGRVNVEDRKGRASA